MRIKTGRKAAAILAVMALAIAACGDGDTDAPDDTDDTTEETDDSDADEPADEPDESGDGDAPEAGELGEVRLAPGEEVQIRSIEAISGDVAFLGIPNQRATELAIEDYGDIQGFGINLGTPLDELCSSEGGQSAAQTVAADDTVLGAIGTSCSGAGVPASELLSNAGMVLVSASNTSPALTQAPFGTVGDNFSEGYYRTAHNDLNQGAAVADYVFNELGLETAAAVHDGDPYTDGLTTAFQDAFEELGGEIVLYTAVNKGDTDMVPILTEVAAAEPEVMFVPIFPPEVNRIAEQVGGVSGMEDVVLFSADGAQVDSFLSIEESEGFYFSGPNLGFEGNENSITGVSASDFLATYNDTYGEAPSAAFWAHAYDATTLLLSSIDEVGVMDGDELVIDRQALRDAMYAASFDGLIGSIDCDEFGDCGAGEIQIILHEDSSVTDATEIPSVYTFVP